MVALDLYAFVIESFATFITDPEASSLNVAVVVAALASLPDNPKQPIIIGSVVGNRLNSNDMDYE